jgi:hypothetical protein
MSHLLRRFVDADSWENGFEEHILAGLEREGQGGGRPLSDEDCDRLWIDVGGEG